MEKLKIETGMETRNQKLETEYKLEIRNRI